MGWRALVPLLLLLLHNAWGAEDAGKSISTHDVFKVLFPHEVIKEAAILMHEKQEKLVEGLAQPTNIKLFIKLVKDSKIPNKGEIIRIAMTFMTKKGNKYESLVESLKRLDRNTAVESAVVYAQYVKVALPRILGKNYELFSKFYNEGHIRKVSGLFYDAFQKTPTEEILWDVRKAWKLRKDFEQEMALIRAGDFTTLEFHWLNESKIADIIRDVQKFSNSKYFSPFMPEFIEDCKMVAIHVIDTAWDETKGKLNDVDPKATIETIYLVVRQIKDLASKLLEYVVIEDLPDDIENGITYVQGLDTKSAKEKIKLLLLFMPSNEDIIQIIEKINLPMLSQEYKNKIEETVRVAANLTVPDIVQDIFIASVLNETKKVSARQVRLVVEFFTNRGKSNNDVNDVVKHVVINTITNRMKGFVNLNVTSLSDLIAELKKAISQIDNIKLSRALNEILADLTNLNPQNAAKIVTDTNQIFQDLFQDEMLQKLMKDPLKFFETADKSVFSDVVATIVDTAKLINETTTYKRCLTFSNYDKIARKIEVERFMKRVKDELLRVNHGEEVIRRLQIDQVANFLIDLVQNGNVKNICIDIKGFIKLIKMFEKEEEEELTNILWLIKGHCINDGKKLDGSNDVMDLLEATHRILLRQNGENPDDFRVRTIMTVIQYFKNRSAMQNKKQ